MKAANKDEIVRGVTSIKVSQPPVMSPTVQVSAFHAENIINYKFKLEFILETFFIS